MNYFKNISKPSLSKVSFLIMGLASLLWFLIRVIPKPSRASYPCMRATAPLMSAFILYVSGLLATIWIFRRQKQVCCNRKPF